MSRPDDGSPPSHTVPGGRHGHTGGTFGPPRRGCSGEMSLAGEPGWNSGPPPDSRPSGERRGGRSENPPGDSSSFALFTPGFPTRHARPEWGAHRPGDHHLGRGLGGTRELGRQDPWDKAQLEWRDRVVRRAEPRLPETAPSPAPEPASPRPYAAGGTSRASVTDVETGGGAS